MCVSSSFHLGWPCRGVYSGDHDSHIVPSTGVDCGGQVLVLAELTMS